MKRQAIPITDVQWQATSPPAMSLQKPSIPITDAPWRDMGVLPPQTVRNFSGINTLDPFSIEPKYATRMKNFSGSGFPGLKLRPGTTLLGGSLGAAIQGIGSWRDQELHVVAGGNWYKFNGSSWSLIRSGLSTSAKMSFCNFKGDLNQISLIAVNGSNASYYYDGSTVQTLGGIPAGVNFVDQHDNRVYAAKENTVYYSALRKAQDWTTVDDASSFTVETDDGELINGIKSGFRHLMVFKPSSFHELWGTGPLNYTLQTISRDVGLLNNNAITTVQGTPYWADQKAVYNYGGAVPKRDFSIPIKGYMEQINKQQYSKVCAGSSANSFYLAIPYGTVTDPDTILEYDTMFQVWYVWQDLKPLAFCELGNTLHIGDTGGRVLKFGGTTDSGAAINYEWVSPPIGSGELSQRAQWYRMWYVVDVPAGSSMNFYLSADATGENWTLVKSIVGSNLQSGRVIIPLDTVANANWVRVRVAGSGPMQITELDYQRRELPMY